jgi:mono/diheme cytochrome c family protein
VIKHPHLQCALITLLISGCTPDTPERVDPVQVEAVPPAEVAPLADSAPVHAPPHVPTVPSTKIDAAPVETHAAVEVEDRSIWDGCYSEEQRLRGEAIYASSCVRCHRENLEGNEAVPTLVGEKFLQRWSRKRVGNLFAYMKKEMPPKDKLEVMAYADVLAFLLSKNGAPIGKTELPSNFAELMSIRMARDE